MLASTASSGTRMETLVPSFSAWSCSTKLAKIKSELPWEQNNKLIALLLCVNNSCLLLEVEKLFVSTKTSLLSTGMNTRMIAGLLMFCSTSLPLEKTSNPLLSLKNALLLWVMSVLTSHLTLSLLSAF